jgi:hypothetical protein
VNQRQDNTSGGTPDIERSWLSVDLAPILSGSYEPPKPTVGQRSDGIGLFYRGKVHSVASASEAGKTWLLLAAAFQEIKAEKHVAYIDFEDSAAGMVGRLLTFGLAPEVIGYYFHYIQPTQPYTSTVHRTDLFQNVIWEHCPTLVVIDGITEAMTTHGLKSNDNDDIAWFSKIFPREIAHSAPEPATVCLDHVVKNADGPSRYALGGVHKLNQIDGAAYVLELRDPFGIGVTGRSAILLAKDRPGQLRKHGLRRKDGLTDFGELVIESHDEAYTEFEITPAVARGGGFPANHRYGQDQRGV